MSIVALSWDSSFEPNSYDADQHIGALVAAYRSLPRNIAKKHLMASIRKVLRRGVPILRRHTPPLSTRRGRYKQGEKPKSTGALRRSVTVRAGQTGKNGDRDAFVWGCLGYKYGFESRKAIWLSEGTIRIAPFRMVDNAMKELGPISAKQLANEMSIALDKATREAASGKNSGVGYRRVRGSRRR